MDMRWNPWHLAFASLIQDFVPPGFDIQTDVQLTVEPQRADMLLIRRIGAERDDGQSGGLSTLWPLLGRVTILEYKSPVRGSFRPGDLVRLWSNGSVYHAAHPEELLSPSDLTLVLVLSSITLMLLQEIARMGWTLAALGDGYGRIDGAGYPLYVVAIDEVCQPGDDGLLELFARREPKDGEPERWLNDWLRQMEKTHANVREMEGYEDLYLRALPIEKRLVGVSAARVLSSFAPAERLLGLDRDHQALALSVELLQALPEAYIRTLAPKTQKKIRKRLATSDH
jgi:hypothetical protein